MLIRIGMEKLSRNKGGNIKNQTNVGSKCDERTKKHFCKKTNRIRNQKIRESCSIQLCNERMVRRRREWEEHVMGMDAERLFKISRDNIPAGRRFPGGPKIKWSDLIPD